LTQSLVRQCYWLFFLLLLLTLGACSGVAVKDPKFANTKAYQERAGKLNAAAEWGLVGKISLDDAEQGGSGRLQWDVKHAFSELDFHGAMGRGAWHLKIGPEGALLRMADGTEQIAPSVDELVQESMGWPIPVEALQWWVRGLAAPGMIEDKQLSPDGLLISLRQFGWSVDFTRYALVEGVDLPVRLNATLDNYRVKLAISRWQMDVSDVLTN